MIIFYFYFQKYIFLTYMYVYVCGTTLKNIKKYAFTQILMLFIKKENKIM